MCRLQRMSCGQEGTVKDENQQTEGRRAGADTPAV